MLATNEWKGLFETNNTTTALNIFNNCILDTLNSCTVSKIHTQKNRCRLKPWMTTVGLVTSLKHRDKLNIKTKKDPTNNKLLIYYKKYRNKLTTLIRKAKETYYIHKIEKCEGKGRDIWQVINEISGRNNTSPTLPIEENIRKELPKYYTY